MARPASLPYRIIPHLFKGIYKLWCGNRVNSSYLQHITTKLKTLSPIHPADMIYVGSAEMMCFTDTSPLLQILNIEHLFRAACVRGHVELAQWIYTFKLHSTHIHEYDDIFFQVCKRGYFDVAQWLWAIKPKSNHYYKDLIMSSFNRAVQNGHLSMAKWLYGLPSFPYVEYPHYIFADYFKHICGNGHMETLKWVWDFNPSFFQTQKEGAFHAACKNGHLHIAQWLWLQDTTHKHPYHRSNDDFAFKYACINNHLPTAQWLWSIDPANRPDPHADNDYAFIRACANGHFRVVKWLWGLTPGRVPTYEARTEAFIQLCDTDNFQIVQWLMGVETVDYDRSIYMKAFFNACTEGYVYMAQWLWYEKKVFQDYYSDYETNFYDVMSSVCKYGHFHMLKWLWSVRLTNHHYKQCFIEDIFVQACFYGHLRIAQWWWGIHTTECSKAHVIQDGFRGACKHLKIFKWLWYLCQTYHFDYHINDYVFRSACLSGNLHMVQWLWNIVPANDRPDHRSLNDYAFRNACYNGHLHVAKWLWNLDMTITPHNNPNGLRHRLLYDNSFRYDLMNQHSTISDWLKKTLTQELLLERLHPS